VEIEQRFDLAEQYLITLASLGEEGLAFPLRAFQRLVIEPLDSSPQFRTLLFRPHRSPLRSAHAKASLSPIANPASRCRERPSTPPPPLRRSGRRRIASRSPGSSARQPPPARSTRHREPPDRARAPPRGSSLHRARAEASRPPAWRISARARSPPESASSNGLKWRRSGRGSAIAPGWRRSVASRLR